MDFYVCLSDERDLLSGSSVRLRLGYEDSDVWFLSTALHWMMGGERFGGKLMSLNP